MAVQPVPEHLHTVTPRLVLSDTRAAIAFYADAFGAELLGEPFAGPEGEVVHCEIRIGDSVLFLTDAGGDGDVCVAPGNGVRPTALMSISVADVDSLWEKAVAAGCEVVYPLADQFYGDRGGRLRDPFGHQWMLSTHIEDVDHDELDRRMQEWIASQA